MICEMCGIKKSHKVFRWYVDEATGKYQKGEADVCNTCEKTPLWKAQMDIIAEGLKPLPMENPAFVGALYMTLKGR